MEKKQAKTRSFDYSWVIVGLCFLVVATSLGLCSSGRSLYLTAITDALGIPRGAFSINNTFRFVTTSVINLFFGVLVTRFGTKKLICAGLVSLITFALINSCASSLWAFYIAGIFLGIGISWTGTTMMSAIVNKWCEKNKSTITGLILAANGIGGAIAVQILSPIIFEEGNPFGYRTSYRLVSIILAVVLVLVLVFYRNPPKKNDGSDTFTRKKKKIRGAGWVGMEYSDVIKKPYFYVALACTFMTGMMLQGLGEIATPHMYDIGLDVDYVALLVSLSGIALTCTKFLTGYIYDRRGIKLSMNLALACAFFSITMLIFVDNTLFGRVLAFIRVFIAAFATPLETVMLPIFVVEFFGNKPFDKLVGIFVSVSAAGFAIGSPLGNVCYDIFGNYNVAFMIFGALMVIVAIAMQFVLRAAHRDRKIILSALEQKEASKEALAPATATLQE